MAVSSGSIGYGVSLAQGAYPTPTTYTALAELLEVDQPKRKVKAVDITNNSSPARTMEKIPGLVDSGEITGKLVYTPAGKAAVESAIGVLASWKIQMPLTGAQTTLGDAFTFAGFVSADGGETPLDDKIVIDVTIEITGPVTFTAGS